MDKYQKASGIMVIIGLALFTILLVTQQLGTLAYTSLITTLLFSCTILFFGEKIEEFDYKNKKVKLYIEKAKEEIYATEKNVRNISLGLAEVIAFILDSQSVGYFESTIITNRLSSLKDKLKVWDEHSEINGKIMACQEKLNNFLDILNVSQEEREKVFSPYKPLEFNETESEN